MPDLDFTGERMVPGKVDPQLEFEHLSRYRFVAPWVDGKTVVDLGSGAGYGAALMKAAGARRVVGLDIALDATRFAQATYGEAGLSFVTTDCARECLRAGSADIVTAFEVIEHLENYRGLLAVASGFLDGRGLFVVSTPNKKVYRDESHAPPNPFHVKEFYYDEFRDLLGEFFPHVLMVGQSTTEGMLFSPLETSAELTASLPEEARDRTLRETTDFLVAICGFDDEVSAAGNRSAFMASSGNELRRRSRMIDALQNELEDRTRWAKSLDATVDAKTAEVARKTVELADKDAEVARKAAELADRDAEVARKAAELADRDAEVAQKTVRLSDLEQELVERQRRTEEIEAEAERSRREVAELRGKLEERLRIARKLKREVAERDRQFLERLRDLERLEARTRQLELDREQSEKLQTALTARVEAAGELIGALEEEQAGQEALLGWNRDSVVEQAGRLHAAQAVGERLDRLTRGLEEASYQHQLGLDYHSHQLAHFSEKLDALQEESLRQAEELARARAVDGEIEALLESRPWRSDSRLARIWRRLRGEIPVADAAIERRVEEALKGFVPSRRPRVTIAVSVDGDFASICDSLASVAGSSAAGGFELLALGTGRDLPLERALRTHPAVRYVKAGRPGDAVASAAVGARGRYVLFLAGGVNLRPDTILRLTESFSALNDAGIVGPRLISDDEEQQVAFGGALDDAGRPFCAGEARDWEALEYSFAQSTAFVPGVCFMARRDLLRRVARRGEDALGELAGATELARRARAEGAGVYVQPGATARCGGQVTELLQEPGASLERPEPAQREAGFEAPTDERPRILVIDHRLPTPDQDSGSLRMSHMLDILRELGCTLTLIPADHLPIQPYCGDLQRAGIEVVVRPWVASPLEFIVEQAHRFDGAIVCRCDVAEDFMDTVSTALAGKPVIFDTVDLQFLRERRRAELEGSAERADTAEAVRERELAIARRADLVWVVSGFEAGLLRDEEPEADVRLLSNIHDIPGSARGFFGRKDLFFVGGFEHQPNVDAVRWLVEEILPLVHREMPDVHTYVIGSKPTAEVRAMESESVTIKGFVPDLAPYLEGCRLSLAPLRYGAGVKGKVNQSLAHGVPCVMTPIAAEGMGLKHGRDAMLGETAEEFAAAVIKTYRNPWLWHRLSRNGVRNTRELFSVEIARREMTEVLTDLGLIGGQRPAEPAIDS
jgi:glycosyltransferase involved in cell wall biosynthesis/SAM-dependent methyltransferase